MKMKEIGKKIKEHVVRNRGKYCLVAGVAVELVLDAILTNYKDVEFGPADQESPFPEKPIGFGITPILKIGVKGKGINYWLTPEDAYNLVEYFQDELGKEINS